MFLNAVNNCNILGDGKTIVTQKINNTICKISENGGGELYFPAGIYLTGTIILKDNVVLNLSAGAKLLSVGEKAEYFTDLEELQSVFEGEENMSGALIYGKNLKNVGIIGQGEIDGNGIKITVGEKNEHLYPKGKNHYAEDNYEFYNTWRPFTLKLINCQNVTLKGIRFTNPASWNVGMVLCKDVFCEGLDVKSHNFYNGDGLDFCSCERVFVSNCTFDCTDDCIALQSAYPDISCKNIHINNCYFTTLFAGIRIGMACLGDFEQITVNNCVFENCACSGIKVQQCEGGKMENIIFSSLIMKNVARPLFFTHNSHEITTKKLRKKGWTFGGVGTLRNVIISNAVIVNDKEFENGGIIFDGAKGFEIKDVTLENIKYEYIGCVDGSLEIGELDNNRPESHVYNGAVWGGLFLRNCRNFSINNLRLSDIGKISERSAILKDCKNVFFDKLQLEGEKACVVQINCNNVTIKK